jgi:hypothetical protein
MDVLRRSARKSRKKKKKNEQVKKIMGVKEKPDITDTIERKRLQWYGHVKRMPEDRIPKLIMEWIPRERRNRERSRKTWVEGVQASSHDNKKFRTRSKEKRRGMAFGFWKTATAVRNTR